MIILSRQDKTKTGHPKNSVNTSAFRVVLGVLFFLLSPDLMAQVPGQGDEQQASQPEQAPLEEVA